MSSIEQKVAEVLYTWVAGHECANAARALAEHEPPLLMPDDSVEEWQAVVAWRNKVGQAEQQNGYGPTREAALADARAHQQWLTYHPVEVAHRCARRYTTPWEPEEVTHTESENQ